ncbi:tetratricopeptide repeat protein [Streptomyces sp. NPDC047706]|uniref:tetratricopeptide repeat protein n=1 Tax=Streptomyces sp. NPDC047706 TaxID=3365486 RepID=UPI003724A573
MSRPGREKKRDQQYGNGGAVIDVRVPGAGPGAAGTAGASIGGVPVFPAAGEELQQTVLNHLHRIALATGRPVLATVHDERIGYVVPLEVHPDGSSCFTAEPVPTGGAGEAVSVPTGGAGEAVSVATGGAGEAVSVPSGSVAEAASTPPRPAPVGQAQRDAPRATGPVQEAVPPPPRPAPPPSPQVAAPASPDRPPAPAPAPASPHPPQAAAPARPAPDQAPAEPSAGPPQDSATHVLRTPQASAAGPASAPTFRLRAIQEPQPLGEFGPPPVMDARPHPEPLAAADLDPDPRPTPPRGFDAVAEAILGPEDEVSSPTSSLLAGPIARIGDAVKAGRIETAAALAEQAVGEASAGLPPGHPELLHLLELTAYVAYLAADPVRAFRLSLDVARSYRRTHDAEGAYGNVYSAATAWRAVRDPELGLELGNELLGLWTELAAEAGPAADDVEELESVRARMVRLAARAGRASGG